MTKKEKEIEKEVLFQIWMTLVLMKARYVATSYSRGARRGLKGGGGEIGNQPVERILKILHLSNG